MSVKFFMHNAVLTAMCVVGYFLFSTGSRCVHCCILSLSQLFIESIKTETVIAYQSQRINHSLYILFLFNLLINEPTQHIIGCLFVFAARQRCQIVDKSSNNSLVFQSFFKRV